MSAARATTLLAFGLSIVAAMSIMLPWYGRIELEGPSEGYRVDKVVMIFWGFEYKGLTWSGLEGPFIGYVPLGLNSLAAAILFSASVWSRGSRGGGRVAAALRGEAAEAHTRRRSRRGLVQVEHTGTGRVREVGRVEQLLHRRGEHAVRIVAQA